ncbi:SDR family oxidoreductase [Microbacterium immunditiarum]|uniref:Citronellol/citronellal dehydrogenase n=1 Tax=Microbacterium immunditiarum TaxID=337480 RepID=A0A7Y9KKI8_9MICO|nr:NAD(P)-dependent oxidoreductase [Microbacterium immunditiarum]NYE18819.1 citronellol/citronellal dehydrogenase [Microbacterium immunditiarum]
MTAQASLSGRTIVMSGGSRGIGLAIALRAAADGANIVLLAKTAQPHPKLRGTVFEAVELIEAAGGRATAVVGDVRDDDSIAEAVAAAEERYGGVDICINNASALQPLKTLDLTPSQYDLMQDINTRGTFMLTRACLPLLVQSDNPHVLTLSPPLNLTSQRWLAEFPGYLLSKYGMSLVTLSLAAEFAEKGVAVNSLWPRTTIGTDAVRNLLGGDAAMSRARRPEIVADAAHAIISAPSSARTGQLLIDEDVLRESGVTDFAPYSYSGVDAGLDGDFFLD